jgi:hypothetical protein
MGFSAMKTKSHPRNLKKLLPLKLTGGVLELARMCK